MAETPKSETQNKTQRVVIRIMVCAFMQLVASCDDIGGNPSCFTDVC